MWSIDVEAGAGLTQSELAHRIGVGQRQVSKVEHGDRAVAFYYQTNFERQTNESAEKLRVAP